MQINANIDSHILKRLKPHFPHPIRKADKESEKPTLPTLPDKPYEYHPEFRRDSALP